MVALRPMFGIDHANQVWDRDVNLFVVPADHDLIFEPNAVGVARKIKGDIAENAPEPHKAMVHLRDGLCDILVVSLGLAQIE